MGISFRQLVIKWLGLNDIEERLEDAIQNWNSSIFEHNNDCPRYIKSIVQKELRKAKK